MLMASTFSVSMGYGAILPLLPLELQRLLPEADAAANAWHTGMLAGVYMFGIFVFAPIWGFVSDRIGRRPVILSGLAGYAVALVMFGLSPSLEIAYLTRTAAGVLAAAVIPVTTAFVGETAAQDQRARRIAWIGASSLAGFLVGPAASGWLAKMGKSLSGTGMPGSAAILLPLYATAFLALLVWIGLCVLLPSAARSDTQAAGLVRHDILRTPGRFLMLLGLNLLITFGLGSFEVGIALQARQALGMDPARLAAMFAECSLVMILTQVVLFSSPISNLPGRVLVVPAFLASAVAFVLLPIAHNFLFMFFVVGLIAAGTGLLMPTLTQMVSVQSVLPLGIALGLQTALSSLGQGLGSVAAGAIYGSIADRMFWISAALMGLGAGIAAFMLRPVSRTSTP
jgi:MFS transporter, DHA1 family, multidrug resistance protein